MNVYRLPLALLLALAICSSPGISATTDLISVGLTRDPDQFIFNPSISADGRFIAFECRSPDLVAGDANGMPDVFVKDRLTGTTELVSVSTQGEQGNAASGSPAISADGRFVGFASWASNLVPADANDSQDVFVRDLLTSTTELVSLSSTGEQANEQWITGVAISAKGRHVVFGSGASDLAAGDTNAEMDVFLRDRLLGTTERVSVSSSAGQGRKDSGCALGAVSADGRFVAFESSSPEFGPRGCVWGICRQVFVRDRVTGITETIGLGTAGEVPDNRCYGASISQDGRFVVFTSHASNLVPEDTNGAVDVFLRDRLSGQTERVSVNSAGEGGNDSSLSGVVSAHGRFVAFRSAASNLVAEDSNGSDVFVRDRLTASTERVSVSASGEQANGPSSMADSPAISADGRFVAFTSAASNLVPSDTNNSHDLFLRDRGPQVLFLDVPLDYWAAFEIGACFRAGIVSGYPDGAYQPTSTVTRVQMAVFISRSLAGGDQNVPPGPASPSFADVPTDYWAYRYVEYAKAQGVVEGTSPRQYGPALTVDRAHMAVFIARALVAPWGDLGLVGYRPPDTPTFTDVPVGSWAYKHIEYLAENQVVGGYPDASYHPTSAVTRDQMAVYVARAFELAS